MYSPRVNKVITHFDGKEDHLVTSVKLEFIEQHSNIKFPSISTNRIGSDWRVLGELVRSPRKYYNPILYSETEPVRFGDWVFNSESGETYQVTEDPIVDYEHKILAFETHFSIKQLEDIVNKKLKDDLYLKCYKDIIIEGQGGYTQRIDNGFRVERNQDQHVILFNKPDLWNIAQEYVEKEFRRGRYDADDQSFLDGLEYGKKLVS